MSASDNTDKNMKAPTAAADIPVTYVTYVSMDESSRPDLRRRQGWHDVYLPPAPVLAVTGIVVFFLYLSWQMDEYEEQLRRRAQSGLWVLLLLGLLALAVLAHHALVDGEGSVVVPVSWWRGQADGGDSGTGTASPWGIAAVVALLLVLASHKPSFQMFRPPWYYK